MWPLSVVLTVVTHATLDAPTGSERSWVKMAAVGVPVALTLWKKGKRRADSNVTSPGTLKLPLNRIGVSWTQEETVRWGCNCWGPAPAGTGNPQKDRREHKWKEQRIVG